MDTFFPVFLSVVLVLRNQSEELEGLLSEAIARVQPIVSDFEIIVIDNASEDGSIARLRSLVGADGVLYAVEYRSGRTSSTIAALTPGLVQQWTVEVPGELDQDSSAALADDGVLYLQLASASSRNSVVAIQTTSPGLARSSWPALRHDNGATNWAGGVF